MAAKCPQCAGSLQVPDDRDTVKCMYCGVDVVVRQAIQLVSGNSKNFLELAQNAAAAGNYTEAYDYFTKVLENEPANAETWFGKGTAAGWQSTLKEFRFSEMLVAYANAVKFTADDKKVEMKLGCANILNEVAVACYQLARKHMSEFIALPNTWPDYLSQCQQVLLLFQTAHDYSPEDKQIIENIIHLCTDNIQGVTYNNPYDNTFNNRVFLSSDYEQEIRQLLATFAKKLQAIDPSYTPPNPKNPKNPKPGCFIVTATMGAENDQTVIFLRSFRDEFLVNSMIGNAFVSWYYVHGPLLARKIEKSLIVRITSYVTVVLPAVLIAKLFFCWKNLRMNHLLKNVEKKNISIQRIK